MCSQADSEYLEGQAKFTAVDDKVFRTAKEPPTTQARHVRAFDEISRKYEPSGVQAYRGHQEYIYEQ
jgi:hypothetical protein